MKILLTSLMIAMIASPGFLLADDTISTIDHDSPKYLKLKTPLSTNKTFILERQVYGVVAEFMERPLKLSKYTIEDWPIIVDALVEDEILFNATVTAWIKNEKGIARAKGESHDFNFDLRIPGFLVLLNLELIKSQGSISTDIESTLNKLRQLAGENFVELQLAYPDVEPLNGQLKTLFQLKELSSMAMTGLLSHMATPEFIQNGLQKAQRKHNLRRNGITAAGTACGAFLGAFTGPGIIVTGLAGGVVGRTLTSFLSSTRLQLWKNTAAIQSFVDSLHLLTP